MPTESLSELRKCIPLTQGELAKVARIGRQSLVRLEIGTTKEARPSTVRKLAKALGRRPDEIQSACRESWRRRAVSKKAG